MTILEHIRKLLDEHAVEYKELHHEETITSEDSARVRGEDISTGGKALLLKVDDEFKLFIISAARKLKSSAIKKQFKAKKVRFATREELFEQTGLVPGSVPPFGEPVLPFPLLVDTSIEQNEKIAFNAGSLTDSITISVEDYLRVSKPTIFHFSKDAE